MTKEAMIKRRSAPHPVSNFVIEPSSLISHSNFVIRHRSPRSQNFPKSPQTFPPPHRLISENAVSKREAKCHRQNPPPATAPPSFFTIFSTAQAFLPFLP